MENYYTSITSNRAFSFGELKAIERFANVKFESKLTELWMVLVYVLIGIVIVLLCGVSATKAFKYYVDQNLYKYTIYKMLGAKNRDIALFMFLEGFVSILIGYAIGILIDYFAIRPMHTILIMQPVQYMVWDFFAIFAASTAGSFAVLLKSIIMRAKSSPIEVKFWQV